MTLAVAIQFPIRSKPDGPGLDYALLLATDSRYTPMQIYGNHGAKIFLICDRTAAVIAGPVLPAFNALQETKRRIEKMNNECDLQEIAKAARGAFRSTLGESTKGKVSCLIGTVTSHGNAFIINLDSDKYFEPQFKREVSSTIGNWAACQAFTKEFPKLRYNLSSGLYSAPTAAVGTLREIAASNDHPNVGGLIQSVIITSEGIKEYVVNKSQDGMDSWTKETIEATEVTLPTPLR